MKTLHYINYSEVFPLMQALGSHFPATNQQSHFFLKPDKNPSMYRQPENKKNVTLDFWRYIFSLILDYSRFLYSLVQKQKLPSSLGFTLKHSICQVSGIGLCVLCAFPVPASVPCPSPRSRSVLCVFETFPRLPNQKNLLCLVLYPALALCHDPCPCLFLRPQSDCYSCSCGCPG